MHAQNGLKSQKTQREQKAQKKPPKKQKAPKALKGTETPRQKNKNANNRISDFFPHRCFLRA